MSAVSQTARLAPLRAPASNKRAERRGARAMRAVAHANSESDDTPRVSRRLLGIGSAALSAAFAKGLTFPTPAEAKKIVSGYTPLDGYDVRPPRQDSPARDADAPRDPHRQKKSVATRKNQQRVFELSYARFRAFLCPHPHPRPPILLPFSA